MESYWINPTIKLGTVKRNKTVEIRFQALPTIPKIKKISPSCGCTSVRFLEDTKQLAVTFKSGEFPNHIEGDIMPIFKNITIIYSDTEQETLSLVGTKLR